MILLLCKHYVASSVQRPACNNQERITGRKASDDRWTRTFGLRGMCSMQRGPVSAQQPACAIKQVRQPCNAQKKGLSIQKKLLTSHQCVLALLSILAACCSWEPMANRKRASGCLRPIPLTSNLSWAPLQSGHLMLQHDRCVDCIG